MVALGKTKDPALMRKTLELGISDEVRSQDTLWVIESVASSGAPGARDTAFAFVKEKWDFFFDRYGTSMNFGRLLKGVVGGYASTAKADEVEAFFKSKGPMPSAQRSIDQAIEGVRTSAAWVERDMDAVRQYMAKACPL